MSLVKGFCTHEYFSLAGTVAGSRYYSTVVVTQILKYVCDVTNYAHSYDIHTNIHTNSLSSY